MDHEDKGDLGDRNVNLVMQREFLSGVVMSRWH
jgi:hypothetical protein